MSHELKDPRLYVAKWLTANAVTVSGRGELIDPAGRDAIQIADAMYLDYLKQVTAYNAEEKLKASNIRSNALVISDKVMDKALNELIGLKKIQARKELIVGLSCATDNLAPVKAWVKAATGSDEDYLVSVVAHWMWQVKRKMHNKDVTHHLMPVLYSGQGSGKSTAINKLLSPLSSFRLNIDLDQMTDDRYFKSMSENYVIMFDEMAGAARADMAALKKQITIQDNDYRPMRTNNVFKVKQACSFIAASNVPVNELLVDNTGMRRFFQLNCADKMDWATINSLDYIAMWRSIDENKEEGYILDHHDEIQAHQEALVTQDAIELYIEDRGLMSDNETLKEVDSDKLYSDYTIWAQGAGFKPQNKVWFGRKMNNRGIVSVQKTINGSKVRVFLVNTECDFNLVSRWS